MSTPTPQRTSLTALLVRVWTYPRRWTRHGVHQRVMPVTITDPTGTHPGVASFTQHHHDPQAITVRTCHANQILTAVLHRDMVTDALTTGHAPTEPDLRAIADVTVTYRRFHLTLHLRATDPPVHIDLPVRAMRRAARAWHATPTPTAAADPFAPMDIP